MSSRRMIERSRVSKRERERESLVENFRMPSSTCMHERSGAKRRTLEIHRKLIQVHRLRRCVDIVPLFSRSTLVENPRHGTTFEDPSPSFISVSNSAGRESRKLFGISALSAES